MAITQEQLISRVANVSYELVLDGSSIFPSVRLAQAILETGGQAPSWNNIFGIKVGTGKTTPYWDGRYVTRTTREVIDGKSVQGVSADWRYYETVEDCVRDHELFLQTPRYAQVRTSTTPQQQCAALYAAGYATDAPTEVDGDPSYSEKLWSIIQSRNFIKYDAEAVKLKQTLNSRLLVLEAGLGDADRRIKALEVQDKLSTVPVWAQAAVNQAVAQGLVDTPEGGSFDFYRALTVLHRRGV